MSSSPGAPPAPQQTEQEPDPRRWKALIVCLVGGFMVLLDVSIVNVALPSIRTGLQASEDQLQWVLSGYALAFGLFLVPAGRIGDLRGRRGTFVISLGLFTLASVACGAAPSSLFLVLARLVQGLAGGALTPQISALIQQMFSGKERGRAFGWFGTVVGISTAIGPLLGGLLIAAFGEQHGWRYVFFVNLPIGVVALPLAWKLIPQRQSRSGRRHDFDPVGVVLLGAGIVAVLLPLVQSQQWHSAAKWWLILVAVVLLGAFLWWEARYRKQGRESLVDLELFRRRSYSFGVGMIALYFGAFTPLFFIFTLYLQTGQGYSPLLAGVTSIPFAIGSGVAAAIGGRLVSRLGRNLVVLGLILVAIGFVGALVAVHLAPDSNTGWVAALPLLIAGFGGGWVISPNQTITLSEVPVAQAGTAGGLLQTGQRVGSAIGIAAVGSVFFGAVGAVAASSTSGSAGGGAKPDPLVWAHAFENGMILSLCLVAAALLIALIDVGVDRRVSRRVGAEANQSPGPSPAHGRHVNGESEPELLHRVRPDLNDAVPPDAPPGRHEIGRHA